MTSSIQNKTSLEQLLTDLILEIADLNTNGGSPREIKLTILNMVLDKLLKELQE